jgi:hypothetical protein
MRIRINYQKKNGFLYCGISVSKEREQLEKCVAAIAAACNEYKSFRLLVKVSGLQGPLPVAELYQLGNFIAEKTSGHYFHIALVVPEETLQPDRFLEKVCRNRGVDIKVFLSAEPAKHWLAQSLANSNPPR